MSEINASTLGLLQMEFRYAMATGNYEKAKEINIELEKILNPEPPKPTS